MTFTKEQCIEAQKQLEKAFPHDCFEYTFTVSKGAARTSYECELRMHLNQYVTGASMEDCIARMQKHL